MWQFLRSLHAAEQQLSEAVAAIAEDEGLHSSLQAEGRELITLLRDLQEVSRKITDRLAGGSGTEKAS